MCNVTGTGHHLQMRKVFTHQARHFDTLVHVVNGQHKNTRLRGTGHTQQVEPCRVAVKRRPAKTPNAFNGLGVMVQHGG